MSPTPPSALPGARWSLANGRHQQPHDLLGQHVESEGLRIRVLRPLAESVQVRFEDEVIIDLAHESDGVWSGIRPGATATMDAIPEVAADALAMQGELAIATGARTGFTGRLAAERIDLFANLIGGLPPFGTMTLDDVEERISNRCFHFRSQTSLLKLLQQNMQHIKIAVAQMNGRSFVAVKIEQRGRIIARTAL